MMDYDVVVIGAGPGGYVAAIRASQLGFKTACIEKEQVLGGTCLNVGCIPSKTLLHATELYSTLKNEGSLFGLKIKGLEPDFKEMMRRKKEVIEGLEKGIHVAFQKNQVEHLLGVAKLVSAHEIEVTNAFGSKTIQAKYVILATGSESIELPFLPFDEKRVLSSTGALSLTQIPKKLVVVGAGVIGVELASVYNRLGTEVTIIEMLDKICLGLDETISKNFLQILKNQGIIFHLGATLKSGVVSDSDVTLTVDLQAETTKTFVADHVLVAVGRKPYYKGLGLENLNLNLTEKKYVQVDGYFRTSVENIFAIGDLIEGPMLAHRASEEGINVAEVIAGNKTFINYLAIPNVIYTSPEVASVGLTESEALAFGFELTIGSCPFKANPRARCMALTDGQVKVIGEKKTGRLLGVHILGATASELIGEATAFLQKKATLKDILQTPHAHPTLSEAILEATEKALQCSIHI